MDDNNTIRRYNDAASVIQKICVLYLIIWSISPPLSSGMLYRFAALGAAGVWFGFEIIRGIQFTKNDVKAVLFVLAIVLTSYIEYGGLGSVLKNIALFMMCLLYIMQTHYKGRWSSLSNLIPLMLALLVFFNIRTFTTLLEDPTIARKIVRNDDEMLPYLARGVGGYALIYIQVCAFPALIMWVMKAARVNRILFCIGVGWAVTYLLVIANAGYSLAIFTSGASLVIMFFYKGKRVTPAVITMLLILIGAMFALIYMEGLRNWLLVQFDGTAVAKKINDLVSSNESGEATGSIYDRVKAYTTSLQTIGKYPIIGAWWYSGGGGHSAILDMFAKYGVVVGYFYVQMLFSRLFYLKKKYEDKMLVNQVCNACFCSILFVAMLDSLTYEFMIVLLIVIPLIISTVNEWDERLKSS